MSKESVKKCRPIEFVVVKEPVRAAKNFDYEEISSELGTIAADTETRLTEDEATV